MAKRAAENEPPIGFFRGFVLQKAGDHKDTLDIKRGGIGSVVEIARVLALSIGSREVNTQARITAAVAAGALSAERGEDLKDALEFISYVRLRHQAAKVRAGQDRPTTSCRPTRSELVRAAQPAGGVLHRPLGAELSRSADTPARTSPNDRSQPTGRLPSCSSARRPPTTRAPEGAAVGRAVAAA
ncbi:MAG: putative nucleotidyltransferase substrate binding domain-containing protein [Dermatophilaceae bacterium]